MMCIHTIMYHQYDTDCHTVMIAVRLSHFSLCFQTQIQELQSTLKTLSVNAKGGKEPESLSERQVEKERAERRLKMLIRRCELYVKRHQMLKEMGIR